MIEINNLTNFSVDKKLFLAVAKKVLKGENKELENLSIAFVSSKEIQKLNKKYRDKDKPTDVLSFENKEGFKGDFLEIVICPEVVKEKKMDEKLDFNMNLVKALIHGILHSVGYDHEVSGAKEQKMNEKEKMFKKEEYYLFKV